MNDQSGNGGMWRRVVTGGGLAKESSFGLTDHHRHRHSPLPIHLVHLVIEECFNVFLSHLISRIHSGRKETMDEVCKGQRGIHLHTL